VAVAFDAVGPSSTAARGVSVSSLSWTHTNVAGSAALVVGFDWDNTSDAGVTASCTVDSVGITAATGNVESDAQTAGFAKAFTVLGLASGARTVQVTASSGAADMEGGSVSFTGAGGFGTAVTNQGTSTTASAVAAGTAASSLVAGVASAGDSLTATTAPATSRYVNNVTAGGGHATGNIAGSTSAGGGSVTMAWTVASSAPWAAIAIEVQAGGAAAAQPVTRAALQAPPRPQLNPSQVISAPVAYRAQVILSGSGTLTAAAPGVGQVPGVIAAPRYYAKPPPSPPSRIAGVAQPVTAAAAALSGSGTLTVAAPGVGGPVPSVIASPVVYARPPPSPASQVPGAPPSAAFAATAALSGSGTLTAAPVLTAAAALSGSGTLTVAVPGVGGPVPAVIAAAVQYARPPSAPPGQIVAGAPLAAFTGTAALSGTGTLTAGPAFAGSAVLTGSGTLTVAAPGVGGPVPAVVQAPVQYARPPASPPGQIVAFTSAAFAGTAALSGAGTLAAAPSFTAAAALSGAGTLTAAYTVGYILFPVVVQAPAPLPPRVPGTPSRLIAAIGAGAFAGAASLSGSGTLTAAPGVVGPPFTVGTLTAATAPTATLAPAGAAASALTASTAPSGALTAASAAAGSGAEYGSTYSATYGPQEGTLTASDQRTGGPR
jgi:hypothetical protein